MKKYVPVYILTLNWAGSKLSLFEPVYICYSLICEMVRIYDQSTFNYTKYEVKIWYENSHHSTKLEI